MTPFNRQCLNKWASDLLLIGQNLYGLQPDLGSNIVSLPKDFISTADSLDRFLSEIYPELTANLPWNYFSSRCILTNKNEDVDEINSIMNKRLPGPVITCTSFDRLEEEEIDDGEQYTTEQLHKQNPSGFPHHMLFILSTIFYISSLFHNIF